MRGVGGNCLAGHWRAPLHMRRGLGEQALTRRCGRRTLDGVSDDARPTLDDWAALSAEERNRLMGSWFTLERWRDPLGVGHTPLHYLLDEAAARFRAQYGNHPLVTAVAFHWPDHGGEPCLSVSTRLFPPQRVEDLPVLFMTFPVRQEPMALRRWWYVEEWRLLLTHLAGWTDEQVDALAQEHDRGLWGGDSGLFYHETAAFHIAHLLVPRSVWQSIHAHAKVRGEIEGALRVVLCSEPYDWDAARARVAEVVARAQRDDTA